MHGILLVQGLKNNWAKSSPRFVGFSFHRFGGFPQHVISHRLAGLLQLGKLTLIPL